MTNVIRLSSRVYIPHVGDNHCDVIESHFAAFAIRIRSLSDRELSAEVASLVERLCQAEGEGAAFDLLKLCEEEQQRRCPTKTDSRVRRVVDDGEIPF
jgi:hypothetical protein